MKEIVISKNEAGQRIDKYLQKLLPNAGISFLYKMMRKKNITLNKKKCSGKEILTIGDNVALFFSEETYMKFSNKQDHCDWKLYSKTDLEKKEIKIIYEDEDLIIFFKPAGILSQKSKSSDISMNEYLIGYLLAANVITIEQLHTFKPAVVNRLDRNTCGLILAGKTLDGLQFLSKILKDRSLEKYYRCIVYGKWKIDDVFMAYIQKDAKSNKVSIHKKQVPQSESIKTGIRSIQYYRQNNIEMTELEIHLYTGKSHQIRAHVASLGYPIVGDLKYCPTKGNLINNIRSQLLVSYRIVFPSLSGKYSYLSQKEIVGILPMNYQTLQESSKYGNME